MLVRRISPGRIGLGLLAVFTVLLATHLVVMVLRLELDRDYLLGIAPRLDFDHEGTVPAWFNGLLLAVASAVTFLWARYAASADRPLTARLIVIGLAFAFLSFDEVAALHERLSFLGSGQGLTRLGGWTVLYVPLAVVLGLWLVPLLLRVPRPTAIILVLAGVMFVSGAVLLEGLGTKIVETIAGVPITQVSPEQWAEIRRNWFYVLEHTAEESLEMCGSILYIYGVFDYFARRGVVIELRFSRR